MSAIASADPPRLLQLEEPLPEVLEPLTFVVTVWAPSKRPRTASSAGACTELSQLSGLGVAALTRTIRTALAPFVLGTTLLSIRNAFRRTESS